MNSFIEKFDREEVLVTLMTMSIVGLITMWMFYTRFLDHDATLTYLILAILFTIAAPALFVYLWFLKKKA